jgi:vacuolar-type H+-ATPase subunit C/Vma6
VFYLSEICLMPLADTAYIIGVMRDKEKYFLREDEYQRLWQAPNEQEAIRVLLDTPYGLFLRDDASFGQALASLTSHLQEEMGWLADAIERQGIVQFITARYDALNIAATLAARHFNQQVPAVSPLGSIPPEYLFSAIHHGSGLEAMAEPWAGVVSRELKLLADGSWSLSGLLERLPQDYLRALSIFASTPLTKSIVSYRQRRLADEADKRPLSEGAALEYERQWDNQLINLLGPYKYQPEGYDPIVAYWFFKEMEAKTVRLLLAAKQGNIPAEESAGLMRHGFVNAI